MATQRKIEVVEEYSQKFKDAKSIFLADFSGLDVAETTNLRRSFRKANVEYRVIKNTLAKRSLEGAGIKDFQEIIKGVNAFAFSSQDAIAPIKVIKEFNKQLVKKNKSLAVRGCLFEGRVFGAEQVDAIAELPSREYLLSQLIGLLQSPMAKLLGVLNATGQKLVGTLESVKNQKS